MVNAPPLLILDEPCEGLDLVNRKKILDLIQFIGAETETDLIYVTYRQEEVPPCITHVMVLREGRVVGMGRRETFPKHGPASP